MKKPIQLQISHGRMYIPIRNMAFHDINPLDAGFQTCLPGYGEEPHKRNNYIFHCITSGKGTFCTEGKKYELSKGDTFLIRPGKEISYFASQENPWSYIWIGFNGTSAKFLDAISDDIFKLDEKLFENIKEALLFLDGRELYLSACISMILCHIVDKPNRFDVVSVVQGYISSKDMLASKVADIAAHMNISAKHLSRIFKQRTGITLNSYLLEARMKKAKHLLELDYKINEIAQQLGYSDLASFCRAFKAYYGYPPSRQKKLHHIREALNPDSSSPINLSKSALKEQMELAKQYINDGYHYIEVAQIFGYLDDDRLGMEAFSKAYENYYGYPLTEEKTKK